MPTGGIALVLFIIAWPRDKGEKRFTKKAFQSIDILGSVLLLAGSILLIFVMQEAGTYVLAWDSAIIGALLVLSPACFIAFTFWQLWLTYHPDFPVKLIFPVKVAVRRVIGGAIL